MCLDGDAVTAAVKRPASLGRVDVRRHASHSALGLVVCCLWATPLMPASLVARAVSLQPPTIARLTPNNGAQTGGTVVHVHGTGFLAGSAVWFGATPATAVTVESNATITAVSPPGTGSVGISVVGPTGASAATPSDRFAYDPPPRGPWLGLNGNSLTYLGPVGRFARDHIVFDREEFVAGELPRARGSLRRAIRRHMIPVVVVEYRGYTGENWGRRDPHFPRGRGIAKYVSGFVRTVSAIRRMYPRKQIMFEPINEPYGYATAAQYAAVVARLIPAARRAGIPADEIYVAAWGKEWVPKMYAARPVLRTLVQGWNFHPYGPPSAMINEASGGILSVPRVQAQITSGQSNIVISEVGWCALTVKRGVGCGQPSVPNGRLAAKRLTQALRHALAMRREGWLRALLVYSRNDGGWAMELPKAILTEQGKALLRFARRHPDG